MKKAFLVLPLAIMLANCSSTRNSNSSSASSGINASGSTAGTDVNAGTSASGSIASTGSGSTSSSGSGSNDMSASASSETSGSARTTNSGSMSGTSSSWNNSTSSISSGSTNWDVYDPNNYMMNPEKYRRPYELGKGGGWTYNKDWRRNTNFTAEAVGQWQLVLTPEVAANWMPDTRRPETYASFWTPEAVMARYQATMAAAARTQDSIAALNATASTNTTASGTTGRRKSSLASKSSSGMTASAETWATGSGTTGTMGTGGSSSTTATTADNSSGTMNNNVTIPFALTAVNGNNFMLPTLSMYIDNGSFTAFTGCNSAVGNIVVNGSSLHFDEASPSTNVECIGGFDQAAFIDRLRRADSYDVVNNQFRLKQGDQVLMVFQKNAQ